MLEVRNLRLADGPPSGLTLTAGRGGITAILGANGAGKSSLLRAISGLAPVRSGQILLDGIDITGLAPHRRAALGLGHCLQGRQIFGPLSIQANLRLAWRHGRRDLPWPAALERAFTSFPGLVPGRALPAIGLTGPLQLQLMLAAATICTPMCLLLDEPSLGLAAGDQAEIYGFIAETCRQHGTTILLAEQTAVLAMQICSHGYVMRLGQVIAEGTASVLLAAGVIPALSTAYAQPHHDPAHPAP